jgi:hypothetical protein
MTVETDPYSAFDPAVAQALRSVFGHEIEQAFAPLRERLRAVDEQARAEAQQAQDAADDESLKQTETRMRSKYADYGANRTTVLEFAIQNGISDLEQAFHAWRGLNAPAEVSPAPVATDAKSERVSEIEARLKAIKYDVSESAKNERKALKHELAEAQDAEVVKRLRSANGDSETRAMRATNEAVKRGDKTEAKRLRADADVIAQMHGREVPKAKPRILTDTSVDERDNALIAALKTRNAFENENTDGATDVATPEE